MEDAKIIQDKNPDNFYQQERFPNVVTTDDLIFELGKNIVDKLNKEKLLESLLKTKQQFESQIIDTEKIKSDAKKQVAVLENSNRQYEENNQKLDAELVKVRNELGIEKQESAILKEELEAALLKKKKTPKKKGR